MPDGSDRIGQRVCDVPVEHLAMIWPNVEPFIEKALARDPIKRFETIDVLQKLMAGQGRLWISFDRARQRFEAAMVTEVIQYPLCRECRVWLIGGDNMRAWRHEFERMVEAYARSEGCARMAGGLRKGWARLSGYQIVGVDLVKPLWH